jgi:threonine/homoserine/homoserine lactone efflux protein
MDATTAFRLLGKGLLIGISIAAPVGPIGLLCIRRTLAEGPRIGLATGLGAATADAVYGTVAAFGLTAISGFLLGQKTWLGLIGGLFLCWIGFQTLRSRPAERPAELASTGLVGAFASTLGLTVANPMTILSFLALFAGLGLGSSPEPGAAVLTVVGVFAGSAVWWLGLTTLVGHLRGRFTPGAMLRVNRASGVVILGFGVYALTTAATGR